MEDSLTHSTTAAAHAGNGRFIYDFGGSKRYGCTAEDIAVWLEDPAQRGGTIYRIHRAYPDGRMEIKGVSADRRLLESGLFFYRESKGEAQLDFEKLTNTASGGPPCRCFVHLADRAGQSASRYVTALIYPSEFEDDMADWLLKRDFAGGDWVEGGISHVTNYYDEEKTVLQRAQLWRAGTQVQSQPSVEGAQVERRRWA